MVIHKDEFIMVMAIGIIMADIIKVEQFLAEVFKGVVVIYTVKQAIIQIKLLQVAKDMVELKVVSRDLMYKLDLINTLIIKDMLDLAVIILDIHLVIVHMEAFKVKGVKVI